MISGYYWERGKEQSPSLILQQFRIQKKQVLLACICEGMGKEWEERLIMWFLKKLPVQLTNKIFVERLAELIETKLFAWEKEMGGSNRHVFGMVFFGQDYISFEIGNTYCGWIYRRFENWSIKKISYNAKQWHIEYGRVESGGRILICNEEYVNGLGDDRILQVLGEKGKWTKERIQKRLKELGGVAEKNRQEGVGAIYVYF